MNFLGDGNLCYMASFLLLNALSVFYQAFRWMQHKDASDFIEILIDIKLNAAMKFEHNMTVSLSDGMKSWDINHPYV